MTTGRRRGEVSGLRWKHVDFARALLLVERNNVQPKAAVIEKKTKSGTSPHVALDPYTISLLEEHRERAIERCTSIGCELTGDAWLFSLSPDGSTPYKPRSISQRYRRLATRLQLRSTRFHALRHYSATELIAARVDVRTVAGRLGQSDGGATALRIYAKFVNEADRLAATTMAGIIPRPIVAALLRWPEAPLRHWHGDQVGFVAAYWLSVPASGDRGGGALVSALRPVLPRCGGAAGRTWRHG
jgi:integrase